MARSRRGSDLWWWLLVVITLVVLSIVLVKRIRDIRAQDAITAMRPCTQDVMVQEVRAYKAATLWICPLVAAAGVLLSAALARRLRRELYHGGRGTAGRLFLGMLVAVAGSLAVAALLFLTGSRCTRAALRGEAVGGLPRDLAAGLYSQLGDVIPVWWLALGLELVAVALVAFILLGMLSRGVTTALARRGR